MSHSNHHAEKRWPLVMVPPCFGDSQLLLNPDWWCVHRSQGTRITNLCPCSFSPLLRLVLLRIGRPRSTSKQAALNTKKHLITNAFPCANEKFQYRCCLLYTSSCFKSPPWAPWLYSFTKYLSLKKHVFVANYWVVVYNQSFSRDVIPASISMNYSSTEKLTLAMSMNQEERLLYFPFSASHLQE